MFFRNALNILYVWCIFCVQKGVIILDGKNSDNNVANLFGFLEQERTITLLNWEKYGKLSKQDYAWLAERGYIKTGGDYDGQFKSAWQIVILTGQEIQDRLLAIGERIKEKYRAEFDTLKRTYTEAVLQSVSAHLRKVKDMSCNLYFILTDGSCSTVLRFF